MTPKAVLFDYGGVLSEVLHPEDGPARLADRVCALLHRAGHSMDHEQVLQDLEVGMRAYDGLKRAQSRMREPREIDPRSFWEFTTCDWVAGPRATVLANAAPLCRYLERTVIERPARKDASDLLRLLRDHGIRTGLVCNCLSGDAARDQLAADGLEGLLGVEVYSDECGYRKPGAALLQAALTALSVHADEAWFVGDRLDRDILAARRAGIRVAVLFRTPSGPGTPLRGVTPDHEIDRLSQLPALLGLATP